MACTPIGMPEALRPIGIAVAKQLPPLVRDGRAHAIGADPIAMTEHQRTHFIGRDIGRRCFHLRHLRLQTLVSRQRHVGAKQRQQQLAKCGGDDCHE